MKSKIKIGILADTREKAIEYCKQIINDNGIEYNKQGKVLTEKEKTELYRRSSDTLRSAAAPAVDGKCRSQLAQGRVLRRRQSVDRT